MTAAAAGDAAADAADAVGAAVVDVTENDTEIRQ